MKVYISRVANIAKDRRWRARNGVTRPELRLEIDPEVIIVDTAGGIIAENARIGYLSKGNTRWVFIRQAGTDSDDSRTGFVVINQHCGFSVERGVSLCVYNAMSPGLHGNSCFQIGVFALPPGCEVILAIRTYLGRHGSYYVRLDANEGFKPLGQDVPLDETEITFI